MSKQSVEVAGWEPGQGLVVRPDVLVTPVAAEVEGGPASRALLALGAAANTLQARALTLHPEATLVPGRFVVQPGTSLKLKASEGDGRLEGVLLIPLHEEEGFWRRAERLAAVVEMLVELRASLAGSSPAVALAWKSPTGRVRVPEEHREALTAQYNARLRALSAGLPGLGPGWDPPDEIVQRVVSLEEVRLLLGPRTALR